MAELITSAGRKAIKKIAHISQVSRALCLMPTAEDFAMRLIGDMKKITNMMNRISTRINEILDRYSNIPVEFLLKGFDEILKKLDDIDDYTKFAIKPTPNTQIINMIILFNSSLTASKPNDKPGVITLSITVFKK